MTPKEREIRKMLREEKEIYCMDLMAYLQTLAISIRMPLGSSKAKIIKPSDNKLYSC